MQAFRKQHSFHVLRFLSIIALTFLILIGLSTDYVTAAENDKKVTIIHTNDIHAQIDDFAKLAAYKQKEEQESDIFFYVDAGDIFSGNPVVDMNKGAPIVDLFNQVGPDLIAIGNHEFDYGQDHLNERIMQADFTFLSANTKVLDASLSQPAPFKVFEKDDVTIGFIALTQAPPATAPKNIEGIEFHDYKESILQTMEAEELQDVDVLIGVNHIGLAEDRKLAEELDVFDAIIGGHSHTEMQNEEVVNGTTIVQAGSHLENIGNMTIILDAYNNIDSIDWTLQSVEQLTEKDEKVQESIDAYNEQMEEELNEEIGETVALNRGARYQRDTSLGNFWTDALRRVVEDSDIAVTNNGGIRADIPAGILTYGHIYEIEPFANEVMVIEMKGKAVLDVLEFSYTREGRNQIDLQTSGLEYVIHVDEEGNYVSVDATVGGEPIEKEKDYTVVVPDYIGTGGSGYNFEGKVITGKAGLMTDTMIDYAKELVETEGIIDVKAEGRIQIKQEAPEKITVAEARDLSVGERVTVEGIVLVDSGAWGAEGFYVHDGTGGINVYQFDQEVQEGDRVIVTGEIDDFNGEIQINSVSSVEVIGNESIPEPTIITIDDLNEGLIGELITLKQGTISELEKVDDYGTFEFKVKVNGSNESIQIRVDSRTGLSFEDFAFADADVVDLTGIVGIYNGTLQIKPRKAEDIVAYEEDIEEPTDPNEPEDPETPEEGEDSPDGDTEEDSSGSDNNKDEEHAAPGTGSNEGSQLPETATNTWNIVAIGGVLFFVGTGMLFIIQRKRKINKS
ncbi:MAG TPA: 5'-nucleotidase C-terminal domain-containing protein [Bacillota bacterium]|nr:5'-nucleotidase C-terminal domain-containing protein [Bacillota bacterium]